MKHTTYNRPPLSYPTCNTKMNSLQEHRSDLEVILEFLEEHYKQESQRKDLWNTSDLFISEEEIPNEGHLNGLEHTSPQKKLPAPSDHQDTASTSKATRGDRGVKCSVSHSQFPRISHDLKAFKRELSQNSTPETCTDSLGSAAPAERGKKLRLFHFLFEMLENPDMAHCVSWVPASEGVFRFSAKHKELVAQLWGQRKGNRRPMTYQKMSRALRNYGRSGEIIKVKKKLTYRFSVTTLSTLQSQTSGTK